MAPSLNKEYVACHRSVPSLQDRYLQTYNAIFNVVTQRDNHPVPFPNTNLLQASRKTVALHIELMIRQPLPLMSGYDSAKDMSFISYWFRV